ncbi:MAG: DUF3857 domain-containing protein [Candidatus Omnitrophica bacterium]|nr:DUF3857 domain-containing protein [Candidatus Omnitrophota bacterium]
MNKKLFIIVSIFFFLSCSNPTGSNDLNDKSFIQLKSKYKKVIEKYQKKIRNNPDNKKLVINLANFYYDFRDYEKAKEILVNLNTNQAKILFAKTLVKLKEYGQAIEVYQNIIDDLRDQEALFLYGEVLEAKNLFPKAIQIYEKVKEPYAQKAKKRIKIIQKRIENIFPENVKELSQQAADFISEIEDEASIILSVDESFEVLPNQTSLSTIHVIKQVLKERGKQSAEVDIGYDSTYEKVELEYARTITKEGKVIYAGQENIRDVSRYLDFPLYSNSRAFIVSMPAVDIGAYLEYKVKIYSSKLIDKDNFNFIYRVREKQPIFKAKFQLTIPEKKEIDIKFFNQRLAKGLDLSPNVVKKLGKKIYNWKFKRLKPIVSEYNMPPVSYVNPAFLVSSFSSWQDIYQWWFSLYRDKLKLNLEIKNFLSTLIKDKKSKIDKAKTIYEYVAKNIRYVAVEYGDSGYEPHSAINVFVNKYGDCKDQAILLVALLQEAGLDAYPVLIPTQRIYPIDKDFPSVTFNHAIAAVKIDDQFVFMDPTSNTTPFGQIPLADQNRRVLLFLENNYKIIKTPGSKENGIVYSMDIDIGPDQNAMIRRKVSSLGYFASSYRGYLQYSHPLRIKEDISQKMIEISPFSKLIDYEIKNKDDLDKRPVLTYTFIGDDFLNPAGLYRVLKPLDQIKLKDSLISKEKRKFPIDFQGIFSKTAYVNINLPSSLEVKYLPESQSLDNKWFSLEIDYKNIGKTIKFYQKFKVKRRFVKKDDYQLFRKDFKKALYYLRSQVILEKEDN